MKKVLIHQPYKYGDFINLIPMVQKLHTIGYDVVFPHSNHTEDLISYLPHIKTFKINPTDINLSINYCEVNNATLINCQFSDNNNKMCTIYGGHLFIEEIKYYFAENILNCGINYTDKYNLSWVRNLEKENELKKILNIGDNDVYNISHLTGDNGRVGRIPNEFKNDNLIEVVKIPGYSLFDWYGIILNARNIFTIQSSVQCFIDCIKYHLNHKNIFLLNDTCEIDRLLVPAYDWNMSFFTNKRLK